MLVVDRGFDTLGVLLRLPNAPNAPGAPGAPRTVRLHGAPTKRDGQNDNALFRVTLRNADVTIFVHLCPAQGVPLCVDAEEEVRVASSHPSDYAVWMVV